MRYCILLLWIVFHGLRLLPASFNPAVSLPLYICDLLSFLMPFALLLRTRYLMSLLYFWGIGLSLQAILTPALALGPRHLEFWVFWFDHAPIMGMAIYMLIVHRFRPTRRDFDWAVCAGLFYIACILPINVVFNFNYGFLGQGSPNHPSLMDWLGPWPWRIGVMVALAWLVMALLLAPWTMARRYRSHRND